MSLLTKALAQSEDSAVNLREAEGGADSFFIFKITRTDSREERIRLGAFYEAYQNLPAEAKRGSIIAKEIICQAFYRKSYFDYPEGECPADKFF